MKLSFLQLLRTCVLVSTNLAECIVSTFSQWGHEFGFMKTVSDYQG